MLRRTPPFWVALVLAMLGGLLIRTAFPAPGIWPLAFLGLSLILFSLRGRSIWGALIVGLTAGAALWGSLIFWLTLYLGPIPWLALCALMTLWVGLSAMLISLVYRWIPPHSSPVMWFGVAPVVIAAIWSARETIAASWPYGGFSWARLAYSQASSPFGDLVSWIGVAGLSFLVAYVSSLVVALAVVPRRTPMFGLAAIILVAALVPVFPSTSSGSFRVLAVQGDSEAGLFSRSQPGDILSDHVSVTLDAASREDLTGVDALVWPENASDIDPLRSRISADALDTLSSKFAAPIVVGTITHPAENIYFNSSLVWVAGQGVTAQYDKARPVPFAEYMPDRAFYRALVPDLVDLVSRDYSPGTRPNVVDVDGVPVGISICFDITDSGLTKRMVEGGAQLIFAQTNNADFGTTDENLQQLEIARIAAMESGRTVVNVSTVGQTAIIQPDGTTSHAIPAYEPGYIMADVELSETVTPAIVASGVIEGGLVAIASVGLLGLGLFAIRRGPQARLPVSRASTPTSH